MKYVIACLRKLVYLESKAWAVDKTASFTEDENMPQGEPNSISLLKFNLGKKKYNILDLFSTHPHLEERLRRLERIKSKKTWINQSKN